MKTFRTVGRYDIQRDSFNHCQIVDTITGNESLRMDKFALRDLILDSDAEIEHFAKAVFNQDFYTN